MSCATPSSALGTRLRATARVHFRQGRGTRKLIKRGEEPEPPPQSAVPRISRLMALAIHVQELVDRGEVADYAELARLAHVPRARISQIMNLTLLAPDIQEAILFLPSTDGTRGSLRARGTADVHRARLAEAGEDGGRRGSLTVPDVGT